MMPVLVIMICRRWIGEVAQVGGGACCDLVVGGFKSEQAVEIGGEALAVAALEAQGEYIRVGDM